MTHCPNDGTALIENKCPKCGYSFAPYVPKPRKNAKVSEVNSFIRRELIKLKMTEDGLKGWIKKWATIPPQNYVTKHQYRGINRFILSFMSDSFFLTKTQVEKLGGEITDPTFRAPVILWLPPEKEDEQEQETEKKVRNYPVMRLYYVYPSHSINGIKSKIPEAPISRSSAEFIDFVKSKGAKVEFHGNGAYFDVSTKVIVVPERGRFEDENEFFITIAHEFSHWVHDKIKSKEAGEKTEREKERDEMVAEIGALYLASVFNIELPENSVRYIDGWLRAAENDERVYISAFQHAEKLIEWLGINKE